MFKKLYFIILITGCIISCKQEGTLPYSELIATAFDWCGPEDSIDCVGDSFTWGAVGKKYPTYLAEMLGKPEDMVHNNGTPGYSSTQILEKLVQDPARKDWNLVLWVGRNNSWDTAQILRDVDRFIAGRKKYLILEILNGTWTSEWKGTPYYQNVTELNLRLKAKHGPHFVPIKEYLQAHANGSQFDSICVANDCVPQSLIVPGDSLHIGDDGNRLVAQKISMHLKACNN